ncbi:MAG: hypothetical protein SH807_07445 [Blastochloris sp.]|nr:hypothetical protein [Blastochloris sp.]
MCNMDLRTVLETSPEAHEKVTSVSLRRVEWSLFYSLDGTKTLLDFAHRYRLKEVEILTIGQSLLDLGLAAESRISIQTFLSTQGLTDKSDEKITIQTYVSEESVGIQPNSKAKDELIPVDLEWTEPKQVTPQDALVKKMDLKAVITYILESTKNPLAVYTIFLKVPPHLLKRCGIKTLPTSSKSPSLFISDTELQSAIMNAVLEKIGVRLPPYIWH